MSEYLIAVDLEGIGGVVGMPYEVLTTSPDYEIAKENAIREINAATAALFDNGATKVAVWDNHGGGKNLDFSKMDSRIEKIEAGKYPYRMDFANDYNFKGIIYLGYHAREGTFNGVLAHTYSSTTVQYAKIDSELVGELEIDSFIAASHGIVPLFLASDKACVDQFAASSPETIFVITKYGKGRNEAILRDEEDVLREIYDGVATAMKKDIPLLSHKLPFTLEVRYTRAEKAAEFYEMAEQDRGISSVKYGDDTHTLIFEINSVNRTSKMI